MIRLRLFVTLWLMYGDVREYSYAKYISEKATQSQNEEIKRVNEEIQSKRRKTVEAFRYGEFVG